MDFWIDGLMSCWTCGWTTRHFWLKEFHDGAERDFQPRRPVFEFVPDFIDGLFEQMNIEKDFQFFVGVRQQIGLADDFQIGIQID